MQPYAAFFVFCRRIWILNLSIWRFLLSFLWVFQSISLRKFWKRIGPMVKKSRVVYWNNVDYLVAGFPCCCVSSGCWMIAGELPVREWLGVTAKFWKYWHVQKHVQQTLFQLTLLSASLSGSSWEMFEGDVMVLTFVEDFALQQLKHLLLKL